MNNLNTLDSNHGLFNYEISEFYVQVSSTNTTFEISQYYDYEIGMDSMQLPALYATENVQVFSFLPDPVSI